MAELMKAAFVREFGKPLTIEEMPIPQPGTGQVLVKVHACGVCGTDLHGWILVSVVFSIRKDNSG